METACANQDPCPGVLKSKVGEQRRQVSSASPDEAFARHAALMSDDDSRTAKAAAASTAEAEGSDCVRKSRCYLRHAPHADQSGSSPGQTAHHIPPWSTVKSVPGHSHGQALCVCLEGASQHLGSHGKNHAAIDYLAEKKGIKHEQPCNLKEYNQLCAQTVEAQCGCNKDCIAAQLDQRFGDPENKSATHKDMNSSAPLSDSDKTAICNSAGIP